MPEKFRFILVLAEDGEVKGTNDERVAKEFAAQENCYVIDAENGTWNEEADGTVTAYIPAQTVYKFD